MNLAAILSMVFWVTPAFSPAVAPRAVQPQLQSTQDKLSNTQPADNSGTTQQQPSSSPGQPSSTPPPSSTAPQNSSGPTRKSKPRRHKHKKTADSSNCATVAAPNASPDASATANVAGAKAPASTNCPPPKTVVKNGGTSEPSVQLTGGEGAAQAQQRSTTDQLLASTEDNLKKIAGRQLTAAQQEMVNQVRRYMEQSKEAVTAGDTERGRMLAQKASLLSDELVKP